MMGTKTDLNFQNTPAELFPDGDWTTAGESAVFCPDQHQQHAPRLAQPSRTERSIRPEWSYPPTIRIHALVRRDIANGLEEIEKMDETVGQILQRLADEGLADQTLVIFIGDNGRCEVRGKQFLYDQGTHVPLIMRWAGHIQPGTVSDDLVSSIDVTATILAAAGVAVPSWMQGRDLLDPSTHKRQYVFTARDKMDQTHDAMRACRDKRFKYILNLMPERAYCQLNEYKERQYPILALLNVMHLKGQLNPLQDRFMQPHKPPEELYDLAHDPYETENLAQDARYAAELARMRKALAEWRSQIGDQGVTDEFRRGGWPSTYPTRTLPEWQTTLDQWNEQLLPGGA